MFGLLSDGHQVKFRQFVLYLESLAMDQLLNIKIHFPFTMCNFDMTGFCIFLTPL